MAVATHLALLRMQLALVVALLLSSGARAYYGGAGGGVCAAGRPGGGTADSTSHGRLQSGTGGYALTWDPPLGTSAGGEPTFVPDTKYTLTLGGGNFRGFAVLPLHGSGGGAVEAATYASSRTCSGRAAGITHNNGMTKTSASGTWTAPKNAETASFRWTVLASKPGNFYINELNIVKQEPVAAPAPSPSVDAGFCANYKSTCVDTSKTDPYPDCEATLAGNNGGMTW